MALWKVVIKQSRDYSHKFQSLFFWMALWKYRVPSVKVAPSKFQSLFFWMALWKISACNFSSFTVRFQSLFFWMALWKSFLAWILSRNHCFNPCFSGWRSERWDQVEIKINAPMFQSLFFWMALWKDFSIPSPVAEILVSILVFLDGALKDVGTKQCNIISWVSILVFLDGALKGYSLFLMDILHVVSILVFLDGALKGVGIFSRWKCWCVSILVFLDGALKESKCAGMVSYWRLFQSLFFWMALWKFYEANPWLQMNGFNPCFSGWRSESVVRYVTRNSIRSFNPCFSGWRSERGDHLHRCALL